MLVTIDSNRLNAMITIFYILHCRYSFTIDFKTAFSTTKNHIDVLPAIKKPHYGIS